MTNLQRDFSSAFTIIRFVTLLVWIAAFGAPVNLAHAQDTHVWNDPGGGVWGTFTKWTPVGVPSSLDVARFNLNADYTVSLINGGQARLLQVLNGDVVFEGSGFGVGDRTLTLEDAFFNTNADVLIRPGSNGKNLTLSSSDDLSVRGSFTVQSGARLESTSAVVDSATSNLRAQVSINGVSSTGEQSEWTTTSLNVGATDLGLVRVAGGGFARINGAATLGDQSGSDGILEVTGKASGNTRSDFRTTGTFFIGKSGVGHFQLREGAFAATSESVLGVEAGGRGTARIESNSPGDSAFWIAGITTVRRGDIVVNSGGTLRTAGATIGTDATSSVTISGAGSGSALGLWEALGNTNIGSFADATLNIEQGGRVEAVNVHVGRGAGSVGRINVSSSNLAQPSRFLQTDDLYLGGDEFGSSGVGHLNLNTNSFAHIEGSTTIYQNSSVVMGPNSKLIARTIDNTDGGFFDFIRGTLHTRIYTGDLTNQAGTLAPYRSTSLTGEGAGDTFISGNYTQQVGATLAIDLVDDSGGGIGYDHLGISEDGILGGTLELTLADGFLPEDTTTFDIVSAANLSGAFANASPGTRLATIDGRGSFLVNYGDTSPFSADNVILSDFLSSILSGDYDGSGLVGAGDLNLVLGAWGEDVTATGVPAGWVNEQPTGLVSAAELNVVLNNWGEGVATPLQVPEPTAALLILLGISGIDRFARQRG